MKKADKNKSFEELRMEDYTANRKGGARNSEWIGFAATTQQPGGIFVSTATEATSGSSFDGTTQDKPLFETTGNSNAFGSSGGGLLGKPAQTQNAGIFGQSVVFGPSTASAAAPEKVMENLQEDLVEAFESLLHRGNFNDALSMISGIGDKIPPPSTINDIIFKVLMKNCDEKTTKEAQRYLLQYQRLLLSKSVDVNLLKSALENKQQFVDIWRVFIHLVRCSFNRNKNKKPSEVVIYPNCDILIKFYVHILTKYLSLDNDLFEVEENQDCRFNFLLTFLNKAHKMTDCNIHKKSDCSGDLFDNLHLLVENKLQADISSDASSTKIESIALNLLRECPDIFNNPDKMNWFFIKCDLPSIQLSVAENKLYELLNPNLIHNLYREAKPKHCPLTLNTIIYEYFFVDSKRAQQNIKSPKPANKQLKKIFLDVKAEDETKLHDLCRKNTMGDLMEVLLNEPNLDINKKNSYGRTPLHVACAARSYYSVKFLIEEGKVDLQSEDKHGLTPLHYAAFLNDIGIAKLLLKHGGKRLTMLLDQFGVKALTYTKNKKLQKELKDAEAGRDPSFKELKATLGVATFSNQEKYSMFLYLLHSILNVYINFFNLDKYKKEGLKKLSHKDGECPHYTIKKGVCDYDVSVMEELSDILDCFITRIQRDADAINIVIRKELAPLKFWRVIAQDYI